MNIIIGWLRELVFEINHILSLLGNDRPVFHSEADFQHALAWKIHYELPDCSMRLEFKPQNIDKRLYVDIWAIDRTNVYAFELKYKTRKLDTTFAGEKFNLLDQSAQDISRYDFLKDIQRLELVSSASTVDSYAVFLTNDSSYWKPPISTKAVDVSFRIHEGRALTGELAWDINAAPGTTRGREQPIVIRGNYYLKWQNYSVFPGVPYGIFKFLSLKIGK